MVMETPSPQCVGREFVRQYYTLLHEAPLHLHRFYSHNSSFVHGGVEKPGEEQPPVMGQGEIHKKIMSLNFRDCHAKIRQVDSQATVGNAVVVQVTGELSNNGQPMRRFMQTFVLAPQSPKKYYVHNDIFRYQDEVFHDNDTDTENPEDTVDSEPEVTENSVTQTDLLQDQGSQYYDQPPMSNGTNLLEEERTESPESPKSEEIEPEVEIGDQYEPDEGQIQTEMEAQDEEKDEPKMEEYDTEHVDEPAVPKPFSWAAMASKNTNSMPPMNQMMTQPPPQTNKGPSPQGFGPRTEVKQEPSPTAPQPQRTPKPSREHGGRERERVGVQKDEGEARGEIMGDRGRGTRFPDSQQLFVGNLPHNVSEKELRQFFETYGNVVELRINTKSPSGKVPNFGFVVFDSPGPVQHILSSKPIKFNGEHRLNVEEKKPRGSEGRPIGRGAPPRSGSAGGGGGFSSRGGSLGRGNIRGGGGGGPPGMRGGGMNRGGISGPRR